MVPWARAVPPGGGSTALLLFLAAALQRGKSRYFLFIFGTSYRDSEWQKSEVREGCSLGRMLTASELELFST